MTREQPGQIDARQLKKFDLCLWWIAITSFCLTIWLLLPSSVFYFFYTPIPFAYRDPLELLASLAIFALLGFLQSQILARKLGIAVQVWWTLSWVIGALLLIVLSSVSHYALLISFSVAHLIQWVILQKQLKRPAYWLIFSSLALIINGLLSRSLFGFFWMSAIMGGIQAYTVVLAALLISCCYALHTAYGLYCSLKNPREVSIDPQTAAYD